VGACAGGNGARKSGAHRSLDHDREVSPRKRCNETPVERLDLYDAPNPHGARKVGVVEWECEGGRPLAGFEIELQDVAIIDFRKVGEDQRPSDDNMRRHVWSSLTTEGCPFVPKFLADQLCNRSLPEARCQAIAWLSDKSLSGHIPAEAFAWKKRSPLFSAPNGTWVATTDSVGPHLSRVEFVSNPCSSERWGSKEVQEDLQTLQDAITLLKKFQGNRRLLPLSLVSTLEGVLIHEPEVFFYCTEITREYFQFTRQLPIAAVLPECCAQLDIPVALLRGMHVDAVRLLIHTIHEFDCGGTTSSNPKEVFKQLQKTPFHHLIVKPTEGDDGEWVEEIARLANIYEELDQSPVRGLQKYGKGKMALHDAEFTWRDFLRCLIAGKGDLLAQWSKHGFVLNDEDFGYGSVDFPACKDGWAIFEDRTLGKGDKRPTGMDGVIGLVSRWGEEMKKFG